MHQVMKEYQLECTDACEDVPQIECFVVCAIYLHQLMMVSLLLHVTVHVSHVSHLPLSQRVLTALTLPHLLRERELPHPTEVEHLTIQEEVLLLEVLQPLIVLTVRKK